MNKRTLVIGIAIVVVAVIAGYAIGVATHPLNQTSPALNQIIAPVSNIVSTSNEVPLVTQANQVLWTAPVVSASLHLVKDAGAESGAKYYNVGTFATGDYKGGDIFIVTVPADGPGVYGSVYRFINQSGKITFITKNSDQLYDGDFLDRSKFSIDSSTVLSDLVFPAKITYNANNFSLEGDNLNEPSFNDMYASSDLKVSFVDSKLGNVYTDVSGEKTSKNGIKQNGFYLTALDGTLRTYSLDINFYDKNHSVPQVTWNDGAMNTAEYTDTDRGGCGSRNYASVAYGLSVNDLTAVGKTSNGDIVYELKDSQNLILQNIYKNEYNPYNGPKKSYSEFIQSHPAFFWFDSFGRLIKFQKSEFVPQAECGKPVIYLYPEKTTNVSVNVEPQGGFTKTEPDYGNGWNVQAEHDGQLTDLKSGNIYPYLFWEGRGGIYTTPKKGFVVTAQDVHSFFVEKLTKLGLNQKEQNDFIEFWEPRMKGAPYFFVTFLGNKDMDAIAPLVITPKPDSVIRILMDFSPLQKPISVEGYEIKTPSRNGFTVVEWGGVLR